MQIEVALRGRRATPTTLSCNGNVAFREIEHAALNGQEPFEVLGNQLTAERLDTDALVTIRGAAFGEPKAEIRARGMTVLAADVKMDLGQNRIWIDGPGIANMQMRRDLSGRARATPTPLELSWLGGMVFDGRTILIQRRCMAKVPMIDCGAMNSQCGSPRTSISTNASTRMRSTSPKSSAAAMW